MGFSRSQFADEGHDLSGPEKLSDPSTQMNRFSYALSTNEHDKVSLPAKEGTEGKNAQSGSWSSLSALPFLPVKGRT